MSLQLTYLQTAYLAAETMQALEMLADETDDYGYYVSCRLALAILTVAVNGQSKGMNIQHVYNALAYAAQVMDGGQ